ncbi:MAG: DUF6136 family protein [Pseudomonadota bacterium]
MTPNYQALRTAHFRLTLKAWFKGLDKAVLAIVAVLQFILTAIVAMTVYGLTQALTLLYAEAADPWDRVLVVAAWQCLSWILLRALREAAFMPRARAFFDTLPVTAAQKLRADLTLGVLGYSFLWLPFGWCLFSANNDNAALSLAELALLSLCVNLTALRGATRPASIAVLALVLFAASAGAGPGSQALRLLATGFAGAALWWSYLPGGIPLRLARPRSDFTDRVALASGLIIPLLANELRSNLLVRLGFIAATFGACLIAMRLRTNDASTASVVVFVAAIAALALHSLPALSRRVLLTKLQFLAGNPAFARRMRFAAYAIPAALFAVALLVAAVFDRSGTAWRDAAIFSGLFAAGVAGTRLEWPVVRWAMPLACMIALIILSAMIGVQ